MYTTENSSLCPKSSYLASIDKDKDGVFSEASKVRSASSYIYVALISVFLIAMLFILITIKSWMSTQLRAEASSFVQNELLAASFSLAEPLLTNKSGDVRQIALQLQGNPLICSVSIVPTSNLLNLRFSIHKPGCIDEDFFSQQIMHFYKNEQILGVIYVTSDQKWQNRRIASWAISLFFCTAVIYFVLFVVIIELIKFYWEKPIHQLCQQVHNHPTDSILENKKFHTSSKEVFYLAKDIQRLTERTCISFNNERNIRYHVETLEQQYHALFSSINTGIALFDEHGHCVLANPSVGQMLKINPIPEGLFGINIQILSTCMGEHNKEFMTLIHDVLINRIMYGAIDINLNDKSHTQSSWIHISVSRHKDTPAFSGMIECIIVDVTRRKKQEEEHRFLAEHDALTGLMNRRAGIALIDHDIRAYFNGCPKDGSGSALVMLDLDRFKWINDTYGHNAGDQILQETARHLQQLSRNTDILVRLGGDEFIAAFIRVQKLDDVLIIAQRLMDRLTQPMTFSGDIQDYIGASLGIAWVEPSTTPFTIEDIITHADMAMYRVKRAGRGGYCVYNVEHQVFSEPVLHGITKLDSLHITSAADKSSDS